MNRKTVTINDLGMFEIPKEFCEPLGLKEKSPVYISTADGTVVLSNTNEGADRAVLRKLDELNRVALPMEIRRFLHIKANDSISLELTEHSIILTK